MSSDEAFVLEVLIALRKVSLEAIVVGNTAAILQGAPVTTQDVDLLVRDTPRNRQKIAAFAALLGGRTMKMTDLADVLTVVGSRVPVDLIFEHIAGGLRFNSLKSRADRISLGPEVALVAALEDVIASKQAAGRDKDHAALPILRAAQMVRDAIVDLPD